MRRTDDTWRRRGVLKGLVASGLAVGVTGVASSPAAAGGEDEGDGSKDDEGDHEKAPEDDEKTSEDDEKTSEDDERDDDGKTPEGDERDGDGKTPEGDGGPRPVFDCSSVNLGQFPDRNDVRVTLTDGSFVSTADGSPETMGSNGRIVRQVVVDGVVYENPDTDCCPGEKSVTFTRDSVTVRREEFVRNLGDEPPADAVDVVLYFADGTEERRESPVDPTDTFRGTGDNEGKALAAFRLNHAAFFSTHVWRNTLVDESTDLDGDGLTDSEEAEAGTSILNTDTDSDGWSDLSEVNRDTDPLEPTSRP